jgi:hypothetical protein
MRIKGADGREYNVASQGVGGAGLGLGIAGTALGLLNGGGNGLLGGLLGGNRCACGNGQDALVTRYEATMMQELANKDGKIALLESNIYTDQKLNDLRNYIDAKVGVVEGAVNAQAVYNATNTATISCIQGQIAQLQGLTKVVIPIANVCPEPMAKYNSWTAPTAPTTGA